MGVDQKKLPSYSSFFGTVLIRIPFISFTLLHLTSPVCCHALHPSGAQEMRGIFGSCTSTRFMTSRWGCSLWNGQFLVINLIPIEDIVTSENKLIELHSHLKDEQMPMYGWTNETKSLVQDLQKTWTGRLAFRPFPGAPWPSRPRSRTRGDVGEPMKDQGSTSGSTASLPRACLVRKLPSRKWFNYKL